MSSLNSLKQKLLEVAVRTQHEGLCRHKSGNASVRDPETGYFIFTPTGKDRDELSIDDLVVVDKDAVVIENPTGLRPTSELLMHLEIYKLRPEVNAVIHTHSKFATAFAIAGKPIPSIVYELQVLGAHEGYIPVAPFARPGTPGLAENVAKTSLVSDTVLMEKHGTVGCGSDIYDAFLKVAYLEELAQMYATVLTITGGTEPVPVDVHEIDSWKYPKEVTYSSTAINPNLEAAHA